MGDDVADSEKTVGKSKIQHNSDRSKTKKSKDDEIEKDNHEVDGAESEDKDENSSYDESDDKAEKSKKISNVKNDEDYNSDHHDEEPVNEDGRESNTKELSKTKVNFTLFFVIRLSFYSLTLTS